MKKQLLLLVMMLLPMITMADAVEIDGIYYNIITKTQEAEVTFGNWSIKGLINPSDGRYSGSIVIPNQINVNGKTYPVTSIGEKAFYYCELLNSITLPNSIISIGDYAFEHCTQLETINMPNSIKSIGSCAFISCKKLSSIDLGSNLSVIGDFAFNYCSSLISIIIPGSLETISICAFCNCTNLSSVKICDGVKYIGQESFENCTSLTTIEIPNSVVIINGFAFMGCNALSKVTMGSGIGLIRTKAFSNCKELTDVYCLAEEVPVTTTDAFQGSYQEYITLHVPANLISSYQQEEPWNTFKAIVDINAVQYTLTYMVDGNIYKQYSLEEGATITPEPAPTKEGCTFSGWSEIPETMPAHDVTVTGSFVPNKYQLTYKVDGEVYKSYNIEYGAIITPEPAPTKEGYTFSGWSEIPATMPDHDVTVTGTFTINKYKLIYLVDGELYKSFEIEHGATITPEPAPTKEGYSFTGWSWIPNKMPAEDVIVTGSFSINKYKLTYIVDGEVYKSYNIEYGASITPETEPTKEGFTFSGWSWIPTKMPAEDVSVSGYFNVNQYTITYIIDNEVYMTEKVDYGSTITPPTPPSREGYDFAWGDYPETMPAYDITIYGTYTTGVNAIGAGEKSNAKIFSINGKQLEKPQKGLNIIRMSDGTTKKVVVK